MTVWMDSPIHSLFFMLIPKNKNIRSARLDTNEKITQLLAEVENINWDIIQNNPDKDCNWDLLSEHPNITWEIIQQNPDKPWNWKSISRNQKKTSESNDET